ncbi:MULTISPECIES: CHAP domain-containing protein [Terrabacteria group]|uniref:CHAP domain-containing protein n=1 Tax=Bacillati TaxID=1783272 RepID=UPI001C6F5292|nr:MULTISPECIES: CHAP domain-containing protein [Terrabacteria group]MBW9212915.1 DUF5011 domain-containing protein [Trueperella sp. zg.1013]
MLNKKLKRIGSFMVSLATACVFAVANSAPSIVRAAGNDTSTTIADLPLIEVSMEDSNPKETIKNLVIQNCAQYDKNIDINNVDFTKSTAEISDFDRTVSGIQSVTAKINLVYRNKNISNDSVGYSLVQNVMVKVEQSGAPILRLKSNRVVVNNGDKWNPANYVSYVNDESGVLPVLKYSGKVDMNKDGRYKVTYMAVDVDGNSTSTTLEVIVRTPTEVKDAIERDKKKLEEKKKEKEKKKKELEKKRKKEEEMKQASQDSSDDSDAESSSPNAIRGGGNNPYGGGWSNCTFGAWQAAHDRSSVNLPNWGNAGAWISNARRTGYATGSAPRAGSIVVYSHHVAYVTEVSGDRVHIVEGNFNGHYNERWVSRYGTGTQSLRGYIYLK